MSKKEFWNKVAYVKCPEPNCKYKTKVRSSLIWHLARVHGYRHAEARDKADETGIYCPVMYRQREAQKK